LLGGVTKHIPKSARCHCAKQLKLSIDNVVSNLNNAATWITLLNFGNAMLLTPHRSGKKHNLTSIIKHGLFTDVSQDAPARNTLQSYQKSDSSLLSASVKSIIGDGNITCKAALRILTSENKPAADNNTTLNALLERQHSLAAGKKMFFTIIILP
jgi:hypothetical protein